MKENKGFSLVELIVVVLIMAIVAVALAPQIIKWVENSRISADIQTRNTLKEQCQIALTETTAFNKVKDGDYVITLTKNSSGTSRFQYDDATGVDITPSTTDAYWASLLKVTGANDFDHFESMFKIKSISDTGNIVLKVKVYENGLTIASLTGITGNDDIEVSSETIPNE